MKTRGSLSVKQVLLCLNRGVHRSLWAISTFSIERSVSAVLSTRSSCQWKQTLLLAEQLVRMLGNDHVFELPYDEMGQVLFFFFFLTNKAETYKDILKSVICPFTQQPPIHSNMGSSCNSQRSSMVLTHKLPISKMLLLVKNTLRY